MFSNSEDVCTTLQATAQNKLSHSLSCFKMLVMEPVCIGKNVAQRESSFSLDSFLVSKAFGPCLPTSRHLLLQRL